MMNDDELNLDDLMGHYLNIFKIYNAGDYERENLVLIAGKDCYLDEYILFQMEYNPETDLPDYARSHFLTFDGLELKKGDRVRIYTCKGEDHEEVGPRTGRRYEVVYWNLDAAVWKEHGSEVKLMKYGDSKTVGFD